MSVIALGPLCLVIVCSLSLLLLFRGIAVLRLFTSFLCVILLLLFFWGFFLFCFFCVCVCFFFFFFFFFFLFFFFFVFFYICRLKIPVNIPRGCYNLEAQRSRGTKRKRNQELIRTKQTQHMEPETHKQTETAIEELPWNIQ